MLAQLPSHDTLYAALLARDPLYDGQVFVGVKSTGIFCRLTCPARTPKPENCQFYENVAACVEAGFRACKKCHPLGPAAEAEEGVQCLLQALNTDPTRRWSEADITKRGLDPSTVRRSFKRHFGLTFLQMARQTRLQHSFTTMANGGRIIDAQFDAGFSSPSAFRTAFTKLLGESPAAFTDTSALRADWFQTPLGAMIAIADPSALHVLEFADRKALPNEIRKLRTATQASIGFGRYDSIDQVETELVDFFAGKSTKFSTPLKLHGGEFTRKVWHALQDIPAGETRSYSDIAGAIDRPSAVRAVARANGANQIAILVPCHRVIGADGALTGYGGGLWRKQKLIDLERQYGRAKEGAIA